MLLVIFALLFLLNFGGRSVIAGTLKPHGHLNAHISRDSSALGNDIPFTLRASAPGSPFDQHNVFAANGSFLVSRYADDDKPHTNCPLNHTRLCPPGKDTVLFLAANVYPANLQVANFDTADPSGPEEVTIGLNSQLGFYLLHPEFPYEVIGPIGRQTAGAQVDLPGGDWPGVFTYPGAPWVACPVSETSLWKIFLNDGDYPYGILPGDRMKGCQEVKLLAYEYTGVRPAAWEYV